MQGSISVWANEKTSSYDISISFDDNYQLDLKVVNELVQMGGHSKTRIAWKKRKWPGSSSSHSFFSCLAVSQERIGVDWRLVCETILFPLDARMQTKINQTPEKKRKQYQSRSINKTRCFVDGILKSPDRLGSKTTATKFRGCAWANWVIVLTVNSVFTAEITPAVT